MNLQNRIIDAGAGFSLGLSLGLKGYPEKQQELLNLLSAIPEDYRDSSVLSDSYLKGAKKTVNTVKTTIPAVLSGVYSVLASAIIGVTDGGDLVDRLFVSVPAAYLGKLVGTPIWRFRNRRGLRENKRVIEQIGKASDANDLSNLYKYLLSQERQDEIEIVFGEVEKLILEGDETLFEEGMKRKGPFKKMFDAITQDPQVYTGAILKLITIKHGKQIDRAILQRDIAKFYDRPYF
jgi:hypothetical protein